MDMLGIISTWVLTLIQVLKKSRNEIQWIGPDPDPDPDPNPKRFGGKFKEIVWSSHAVKPTPISTTKN